METRANHILIGGFVLLVALGILGFIVWIAKLQIDREFARYFIDFEGSVSGLSLGSDVLYNGIPVGAVKDIRIDPENPRRVRVLVEVDGEVPMREDSVAQLQLKGITGVSEVLIEGGTPSSPLLVARAGQKYPVIASKPSRFERLFDGAPEVLTSALELLGRANALLSLENRQAISDILLNLSTVSGAVASRTDTLTKLIDDLDATSSDMRSAAAAVSAITGDARKLVATTEQTITAARGVLQTTDRLMQSDVKALLTDLRTTSRSAAQLSQELEALVAENRRPLNEFATEGLNDFTRMVREMRELVASLTRVSEKIESDPARFLFGNQSRGFQAQ